MFVCIAAWALARRARLPKHQMQAYSNIQSLTIEEARRVLTEIANLSTSLDRLVFESTSAVINARAAPQPAALPPAPAQPEPAPPVSAPPKAPAAPPAAPTVHPPTAAMSRMSVAQQPAPPPPAPPPPAATFVQPAPPADGVWGKDKGWAEMTAEEQSWAVVIGYDGASWDAGDVVPTCQNSWTRLTNAEQQAAANLGYTAVAWNAELGDDVEAEAIAPPAAAPPMPPPVPAAPAPVPAAPVPTPAPMPVAAEVPATGLPAPVPGRSAKDGGWDEMTAHEKRAAGMIGYDQASWDAGDAVSTTTHPWNQLLTGKRPLHRSPTWRLHRVESSRFDTTRLDSTELDSSRVDTTRLDSTELDSTRLDSTRRDSTRLTRLASSRLAST